MINAHSDLQDEAWEFIKWMTAPEQLVTNAKVGSKLPVRKSLYDDPEVLNNVPVAKPRQGGDHRQLHAAPGLPLLLGRLPGTRRAVQRLPLRRHLPRRRRSNPARRPATDRRPGRRGGGLKRAAARFSTSAFQPVSISALQLV